MGSGQRNGVVLTGYEITEMGFLTASGLNGAKYMIFRH
jgi:hypothetical protein